ncbi:MAG: hypothetical protein ACTSSI_16890 [Candidatus Helarchaeota archaeon]
MEDFYRKLKEAKLAYDKNDKTNAIASYLEATRLAIIHELSDMIIEPLQSVLKILEEIKDLENIEVLKHFISEIQLSIERNLISRGQDQEVILSKLMNIKSSLISRVQNLIDERKDVSSIRRKAEALSKLVEKERETLEEEVSKLDLEGVLDDKIREKSEKLSKQAFQAPSPPGRKPPTEVPGTVSHQLQLLKPFQKRKVKRERE